MCSKHEEQALHYYNPFHCPTMHANRACPSQHGDTIEDSSYTIKMKFKQKHNRDLYKILQASKQTSSDSVMPTSYEMRYHQGLIDLGEGMQLCIC